MLDAPAEQGGPRPVPTGITGPPRSASVLAEVLRECRPELAGLVAQGGKNWPERRWLMTAWATVLGSDTNTRHVLFAAGPGFGKTVAAAQFGLTAAADGWTVTGAFFRHGYASLEDPLGFVKYLSGQLARLLPGFSDAREASRMESGAGNPIQVQISGGISVIATKVSGKVVAAQVTTSSGRPVDRAWRCDIAEPLAALHRTRSLPPVLIVADALDETSAATRLMLADGLTLLPEPVRVLMTARPGTMLPIGDPATNATVARLQPDEVTPAVEPSGGGQPADASRHQDAGLMAAWASARLEETGADHAWAEHLGTRIANTAERTFLVAAYLTDDLVRRLGAGEEMPPADDVDLPTGGLSGVYDAFLTRTFGEDTSKWRTLGRPVLGSLSVALGSGLTTAMISAASQLELTDVTDTLTDCAAFLTGAPAASGVTVWRIWHRSFADHLHGSTTYRVRPWGWQLRLGAALLPVALKATASAILDSDYRHQYATTNAVPHLIDATTDPEGVTPQPAHTALAGIDAGGWLEALVLLDGPGSAAVQVERLASVGPSDVPWHKVAEAILEQAHVLNAPLTLTDGFTLGQLSLEAARSGDTGLTATLELWSAMTPMLLARWSTAVSAGDVVTTHTGGITVMVATELAGEQLCLIGGHDGWVRARSPRTGQAAGAWRVPDHRRVNCLACVGEVVTDGESGTGDGAGDRGDGPTALVAVGTPTGTYALRWGSDGPVSVLWQCGDGPVTAALAFGLDADPGGDSADRWLLVTSHREELRARDLITGEPAGSPPSLPMPVIALTSIVVPDGDSSPRRQAVLAGCISDSGRSVIWDPHTDEMIGELQFGAPVGCLAQAPGATPCPLAVGLLSGEVKVGSIAAADGALEFVLSVERNVGPTRKVSSESVTVVTWTRSGSELSLLVGDTAGRIHRLDPASMARSGPWTPGHASRVVALITNADNDSDGFISAGFEGLVKSWQPTDIDPAMWPDQVLTLDVVAAPDAPVTVVCAHATGELSERRTDTGQLVGRRKVHGSPVWALTWAGPDFGLVSGDSRGVLVRSRCEAPGPQDIGPSWRSGELARLSGRVSGISSGELDGRTVVLASTMFSELLVLDASGSRLDYPPFGGLPLMTRLATTSAGQCLIVEREVTADMQAITGNRAGRELQGISPLPQPGADSLRPIWRIRWDDPEMLGAWEVAWPDKDPNGASGGQPALLVAGLRDGAVLTFDLDQVEADPHLGLNQHQVHEAWPARSPVATIAVGLVGERFVTAWTTDDGWLFVEHSWQDPPLRMQLGTRVLVTRIAPDGTILLGGTGGVTAVRLR